LQATQTDGATDASKEPRPQLATISLSYPARFLGVAVICQAVSLIATFLPWTTFLGATFAGWREFAPQELLYDGLAGRVNIFASLVMFVGLALVVERRSTSLFCLYGYVLIAWNLGLSIWLAILDSRLVDLQGYGLFVTRLAAGGVVVFSFAAIISQSFRERE
jgi:hypothetical protein